MKRKGCFFFIACIVITVITVYFYDRRLIIWKEFQGQEFSIPETGTVKVIFSGNFSNVDTVFCKSTCSGNPYNLFICIETPETIKEIKLKSLCIMDKERETVLQNLDENRFKYEKSEPCKNYYSARKLELPHKPLLVKLSVEFKTGQEVIIKDYVFHIKPKYEKYYSSDILSAIASI